MADIQDQRDSEAFLPCSFKFHNFSAKISDITVNYEIIKMENSLYLWIGDDGKMDDLSFALASDLDRQSIVTKIIGPADATSTNMAKRLSMKLGKPVYVSFNVTASNIILPEIERRIQEEFKTHADLLSFES